jgi:hypothetical protein
VNENGKSGLLCVQGDGTASAYAKAFRLGEVCAWVLETECTFLCVGITCVYCMSIVRKVLFSGSGEAKAAKQKACAADFAEGLLEKAETGIGLN